jgi:hypothetical protein
MNNIDLMNKIGGKIHASNIPAKHIKNDEIKTPQNLSVFDNNYIDFTNRYNQLPAFCEHLPTLIKDAMIILKDMNNTPYELSICTLLGAINSCTHTRYNVDSIVYKIRPTTLFIMTILDTGGGKSSLWNEIKDPFEDYQQFMYEALRNENARYISENKVYTSKIREYEKEKELGNNPKFPDKPMPAETADYIISKTTSGGITDVLVSQPNASLISDEAGEFFSSHTFQGGKNDANRAIEMTSMLTKFWDGSPVQRNTKETKVTVKNRRVNLFFMVQAMVIRDVLNNSMFQEQGFIHRILISRIDDYEKPDMYVDTVNRNRTDELRRQLKRFNNRLKEILDIRPRMVPDKHFELDPIIITLDDNAATYLANFYNSTKKYGKENNILERYSGFANRLHEHSLRIAATLAAFEHRTVVNINDAKASVSLMHFFIDERSKLDLGIEDTNPILTRGANLFLAWWKLDKNKDYIGTLNDLRKEGPNFQRALSSEQREELLTELIKNKDVVCVETVASNKRTVRKYRLRLANDVVTE